MTARLWLIVGALGALLALAAGLVAAGKAWGNSAARAELQPKLSTASGDLRQAAAALRASATRFREIDAATAAAIEAEREAKFRAEAAVAAAARQRNDLAAKLAEINAARDDSPCARMPVGVPLR
jgi:small-conductance mechanosensitive channel